MEKALFPAHLLCMPQLKNQLLLKAHFNSTRRDELVQLEYRTVTYLLAKLQILEEIIRGEFKKTQQFDMSIAVAFNKGFQGLETSCK